MSEHRTWTEIVRDNPDHSRWYVERFRTMAAEGRDLDGEARLVDAMVGRGSRILDAGCGGGRLGGYLHRAGHTVVGVDIDPVLVEAAEEDHPGPTWLVGDLATLELPDRFDVVVSAGNVITFVDPAARRTVLERLGAHLADEGRLVVGFGAGRGYTFEQFLDDARSVGLAEELLLSSWDLRPFRETSEFLVAVLSRRS